MFDQVVMEGFFEARTLKWRMRERKSQPCKELGTAF